MPCLTLMLDDKIWLNWAESKNIKLNMKIKNRIITRYCFVSITTFQRVMIYIRLEFKYLSTKQISAYMSKKGPQGIHLTFAPSESVGSFCAFSGPVFDITCAPVAIFTWSRLQGWANNYGQSGAFHSKLMPKLYQCDSNYNRIWQDSIRF